MWLLPVVVAAAARYQPAAIRPGIGALAALGLVALVVHRPQTALLALVALLPFQQLILASALRFGVPATVVRDLGFWKEAVVAGCVLAALRGLRKERRPLDAVDALVLVYLGIVGLYYLFPPLFVHAGPSGIGPPTDTTTLNTALRNDTVFVILLFAARRLPVDAPFRRRFVSILLAVGTAVAAVGIFELLFSNAWNHLIVSTLQVPHYLLTVLHVPSRNPDDIRVYSVVGGRLVLRIGSVFLNQLTCGFYLTIALAISLERVARGDRRLVIHLSAAVLFVAILLTQTRAAIIGAIIVIACTLRPSIERRGPVRARYTLLVVAAMLAVAPLTVATGLAARTSATVAGESSTHLHIDRTTAGARALIAAPLGRGLGTGATNGTRFQVATTLTSENYYLQVGNETGAVSMVVFMALVVVLNRRLRRLVRGRSDVLATSWRGAFLGLSVAAVLLQVWLDLAVSWTVWAGVGVCLGVGVRQTDSPAGVGAAPATRRFVSAAARRWPLVLATVAVVVVATHQTVPTPPQFRADTTLVIGLPQFLIPHGPTDPYQDLTAGIDRQRRNYSVALRGPPLISNVLARAGVARSPATVAAETRVVLPPGTQLLQITVTDPDPAAARALADSVAGALIAVAPSLQDPNGLAIGSTADLSVSVTGPTVVAPVPPVDPSRRRAVDAAALGLVAGLWLAVLMGYLDLTIREARDISDRLDMPVLATVARSRGA